MMQGFLRFLFAPERRIHLLLPAALLTLLVSLFSVAAILPEQAFALETTKFTAQPNTDSGSTILGGKTTRITWEALCGDDEFVMTLVVKFPEGTDYDDDKLQAQSRVKIIDGTDLSDPENLSIVREGDTVTATFNYVKAGTQLRFQIYGVIFSTDGGEMPLELSYNSFYERDFTDLETEYILVANSSKLQQFADWLGNRSWVKAWNSVTFLNLFLNPVLVVRSLPVVLQGFFKALGIVLVAFPAAIPVGLVLALMRISKRKLLRGLASLYVNVVRGTPLFLQIYVAFFGLPLAGVKLPAFLLGSIVLAMNSAAYMCEIFRAGILSIPKGQFEASRSLGMNGTQTMIFVIIPQMVRRVIPTLTSEFILLYKDTSLLAAVGFMEIIMYARTIVATTGSITPYIVAALFYLVITLPLAKLVGIAEARLSGTDGGTAQPAKTKKAKVAKNAAVPVAAPALDAAVAAELAAPAEVAEELAQILADDATVSAPAEQ